MSLNWSHTQHVYLVLFYHKGKKLEYIGNEENQKSDRYLNTKHFHKVLGNLHKIMKYIQVSKEIIHSYTILLD